MGTGHSTGRTMRSECSGSEGGRRSHGQRGHCLSGFSPMTTLSVRRWVAKGGPEGRRCGFPRCLSEPGFLIDIGRECPPKHCLAPTHEIAARSSFQTMIWSGTSVRGHLRRPSTERGIRACGGVPGTPLCRNNHPVPQRAAHNGATGLPREARQTSALPATMEAAGARAAWSQPSNPPSSDHADWATLGRQGRPRRPESNAGLVPDIPSHRDPEAPPPTPAPPLSTPSGPLRNASPARPTRRGCHQNGPPAARRGGAREPSPEGRCCHPWCGGFREERR